MSTFPIIAIDPGNTQSGYCVIDRSTLRPLEFGKIDNLTGCLPSSPEFPEAPIVL